MKILEHCEQRLREIFKEESFHIIAIAITGSSAYGMNTKDSDTDIMGIFLPPLSYVLGVDKIEQVLLKKNIDIIEGTLFSFSKWFDLMIQQNPNVLELLWHTDNMYVYEDDIFWPQLYELRDQFLSKKLKHSYGGYAWAQMQRLTKLNQKVNQNTKRLDNFEKFGYDVKAASHVFRLLNSALDALIDKEITVLRPERQFLLAIREGKYTYEEMRKMADDKIALIEQAYVKSDLRNKVDFDLQRRTHISILLTWLKMIQDNEKTKSSSVIHD